MNVVYNFKKIADNEVITVTSLEAKIGASKGVLSRSIANNTDIQVKWLVKIAENYPQYNPHWLLTGKGNMLQKATKQIKIHRCPMLLPLIIKAMKTLFLCLLKPLQVI